MQVVIAVFACAVLGSASSVHPQWEGYKQHFSKEYSSIEEELERHEIFKASLERIDALNRQNGEPVFGLNVMSDRRPDEHYQRGSMPPKKRDTSRQVLEVVNAQKPAAIDWRRTRAVTPVKNQGQCGSCWAFSAAETIESTYMLKTGLEYGITLSPQQIASCDATSYGCGGGWTENAYEYVASVGGLASSWFWPYAEGLLPGNGNCSSKSCTQSCNAHNESLLVPGNVWGIGRYIAVSNYTYATPPCTSGACTKQDLKKLAASLEDGPISICINAGAWDDYTGGVMTASACGGMAAQDIDHCVQLVGYNTSAPKPYWIVRNSWNTAWGMNGYIHLEFDANTCGIANGATVPIIANAADVDAVQKRADMFLQATGGEARTRQILI